MNPLTEEQIRILRQVRRPAIRSIDRNVGKYSVPIATQLARKGLVERIYAGRYALTEAGYAALEQIDQQPAPKL